MAFFCLQAPLLLAEAWLHTLGRQAGIRLPHVVRTAATLLVLHCCEWRACSACQAAAAAAVDWSFVSLWHSKHACKLPSMLAVAAWMFYPDAVASRAPARLLEHWWPLALGPSICGPFA